MNEIKQAVFNAKSKSYEFTFKGVISQILPTPKFTAKGKVYREGYAKITLPNGESKEIFATLWDRSYQIHTEAFVEGMPIQIIAQTTRDATSGKIKTFCKMQLPKRALDLSDFKVEVDFDQVNDVEYDSLSKQKLEDLEERRKATADLYTYDLEPAETSKSEETTVANNVIDRELVT